MSRTPRAQGIKKRKASFYVLVGDKLRFEGILPSSGFKGRGLFLEHAY